METPMRIDRRTLLTGLISAGALAAGPLAAKAPFASAQAPGFYRRPIGDFQLTALNDGFIPLDLSVFPDLAPETAAEILAEYGLSALPQTPVNGFLLNTPDRTILIDAGAGALDAFGPGLGRLTANLAAAGVTPEQVDAVVLTHAHPDHHEGLVTADGAAVFPNAELILHAAEQAYWTDDANLSAAPDGVKPFFASARKALAAYADRTQPSEDGEIFPGLTLTRSPGHTAGHSVLHVASGEEQALILGDSLHNVMIHPALPDQGFGFDADPAMAAQSRRRIFDRAAAEGLLVAAAHVTFPSLGRVVRDGDAYAYALEPWTSDI
jgi:glyoxylase-like metal-dependent hydrolase (beta-lactamase superfamily II)